MASPEAREALLRAVERMGHEKSDPEGELRGRRNFGWWHPATFTDELVRLGALAPAGPEERGEGLRGFPVTDDTYDAPDGTVMTFERVRGTWEPRDTPAPDERLLDAVRAYGDARADVAYGRATRKAIDLAWDRLLVAARIPPMDQRALAPAPDEREWRDDFTCSCRRQGTERCWDHRHRYQPPGVELGHIACEPHGHDAFPVPEHGDHPRDSS